MAWVETSWFKPKITSEACSVRTDSNSVKQARTTRFEGILRSKKEVEHGLAEKRKRLPP